MRQDKKRQVTWDPSIEEVGQKVIPPQKRQKTNSFLFTEAYQDLRKGIEQDLERSSIKLLIAKLDYLRNQKKLPSYMKDICFGMFNWALKHTNVLLITYLVQHLPERTAFILVNHENYAELKQFMVAHLNQWDSEAAIEEDVMMILKALLTIQPNGLIQEIIETVLQESSCPLSVIKAVNHHLSLEEKEFDGEAPSFLSRTSKNIRMFNAQEISFPHQELSFFKPEKNNTP